jgi:hypothetical protein
VDAAADDITDDERDAGAGQPDHVEPVAAHVDVGRRQVAVGDVDRRLPRQPPRKKAVLERESERPLAGVAAGVVDGQGRSGHQFLGEDDVVVLEGVGTPPAGEEGDAQYGPAGADRHDQERVEPPADHPAGPGGVPRRPAGDALVRHPVQAGLAGGQAAGGGGELRIDVDLPRLPTRLRKTLSDGLTGDATQRHGAHKWARPRLTPSQDGLEQVDADEVGEAGRDYVGQLLGGTGHIEGAADPAAGLGQQREPLAGPVVLAEVEPGREHTSNLFGRVLHRGYADRPRVLARLVRRLVVALPQHRRAGVHRPLEVFGELVVQGVREHVQQMPSPDAGGVGLADTDRLAGGGVQPPEP